MESLKLETLDKILKYEDKDVRVVGNDQNPWFCGRDVCGVLGYSNYRNAISKHVDDECKKELIKIGVQRTLTHNEGQMAYINKRGLQQLISKSKMCGPDKLQQLVKVFDIQLFITPRKEHLHLEAIEKTFSKVNMYKQFKVGKYRVDLYIEEYNLVVECDEYNHSNRNPQEEKERELFIKEELECDFVRFNPDAKNFSIFSVLGDVHQYLLNKKIEEKDTVIASQAQKIKLLREQL